MCRPELLHPCYARCLYYNHICSLVLYAADSAVYRYPKERRWLQGFPSLKSVRGGDDMGCSR